MRRFPGSVWGFALALALITSLPYIVGAIRAPDGWQYSGAAATPGGAQVDYNSHMAKMWQGSRGQWDYRLLFTHEAHPGLFPVQGFYVALGALATLTPFSPPVVYHLARFVLTVAMVLAVWAFAARFFDQPGERWLVTLFGTVVGGWSWLLLLVAPQMAQTLAPIEFWLSDAFNLLGAFTMPHFAAAILLQIVAFLAFDRWVRLSDDPGEAAPRSYGIGNAGLLIVMTVALAIDSVIQPYAVLMTGPLLVMLAAYHVFSAGRLTWRRAVWLIIPLGLHSAIVLYQFLIINADPIWAAFTAQNVTASPPVIYYLLGYLPLILPIVLGARSFLLGESDDRWWLPLLWVALVAVLLYAPFPTQRRYLLGVQTPLALMAAYGWSRVVLPRFAGGYGKIATGVYLTLAAVGLALMVIGNVLSLGQPEVNRKPFYEPDAVQGYAWLRENADPDDLVLTTFDWNGQGSGGDLVAATGMRVFMGHWIETADFDGKIDQIGRFYNSATEDHWRREFLADSGSRYIWYDEFARELGEWNPATADYLEPVYDTGRVTVYRVIP
jgi:hypothetical protein